VPGVLAPQMLMALKRRYIGPAGLTPQADLTASTGTFLPMDLREDVAVRLLCWHRTLGLLAELGWTNPRLHNGYLSTKPPAAAPLPWHSDVYYPAPGSTPPEVLCLYYLQDTNEENGCLRVVPGSHLDPKAVEHAHHRAGHATAEPHAGEVSVPVRAGDLVLADRRLLHATHANHSRQWRTCLTVTYVPRFHTLAEEVQARIVANPCLPAPGWWRTSNGTKAVDPRLRTLLPTYDGDASPVEIAQ
jgi:hypothetical protein